MYWGAQWAAWQAANPGVAVPVDAKQFFHDTMIRGYGIRDPIQSYWDTWNKLHQGPGQSIDEFNVEFEQAAINLGAVLSEDVKIERYRSAIQADLREMCRTSTTGERWANLRDLIQFATLKWPTVEALIAKKRSVSQPTKSMGGKRKATQGSPSKRARLSSAQLSPEKLAYNLEHRLCHKCGEPNHIAKDCPGESQSKTSKKKGKASGNKSKEKSSADF